MFEQEITILIIDNNSPFVLPLIRSFSGFKNIQLDVLLWSEERPQPFNYSRYLRKVYRAEDLNPRHFFEQVSGVVTKSLADLIIPTREWISELLYENKSRLEEIIKIHPVPEPDTLRITANKWNLNHWLRENDFPFAEAASLEQDWSGNFPVLLKPVSGIGGEGILLAKNREQLDRELCRKQVKNGDYFLQAFVKGYDIDISFFAVDGEIKYHTIQRGLISGSFTYSRGIEFVKNEEFFNLAKKIIHELAYTGIGHLDFRYDDQKKEYVLIDFNARYWSSVQGSRAAGVNFPLLSAAYSMGIPLGNPEYKTGYYYFASAAIKVFFRNFFTKTYYSVKLRDTQLYYIYKDPKPELIFLIRQIFKPIFRTLRQ